MSNYVKTTNFLIKDSLVTGDPNKVIKGTDLDVEFNNVQTAVNSKANINSPDLTGVPTAPTAASGTNTTQIATTAFVVNSAGGILLNNTWTGTNTWTLDGSFTSTGALQIPAGTTAQQPTGINGKIRYNTTTGKYEGYSGTAWASLGGGTTGGGNDEVFLLNNKVITTSYSIPSTKNAMSTGPLTINSGVTITVPSGSKWVVL